jgi:tetratricopeptide (TPR) repeat protein
LPTLDSLDIPDILANLVERSLVVFDPATGRYHLTESMRAYGHDQLGEEEEGLRRKHFQCFAEFSKTIKDLVTGDVDDRALLRSFIQEVDNLRAAIEWSCTHDPEGFLHLMAWSAPAWTRVYAREGLRHLNRALAAAPEADDEDHITARSNLAHLKLRIGDMEGLEDLLNRALQQLEEVDLPALRLSTTLRMAWYSTWIQDWDRVESLSREVIQLSQDHESKAHLSIAYLHLGEAARAQGKWQEALEYLEASLTNSPPAGVMPLVATFNLGGAALQSGDLDQAQVHYRESIRLAAALYDDPTEATNAYDGVLGLGFVALKRNAYRKAGLLMGNSNARLRAQAISLDPVDDSLFKELLALGLEAGGKEFESSFEEGQLLSTDELDEMLSQD